MSNAGRNLLFISLVFLCSLNVSAMPIGPLDIDFRQWDGADGANQFSAGNVRARALANNPDRAGSVLHQDSISGLGIQDSSCGETYDEINACERLRVIFDWQADDSYYVSGAWITNLFDAPDGSTNRGERGRLRLELGDNDLVITFFGEDSDPETGAQFIDFGGYYQMSRIDLWTPGYSSNNGNPDNEFSLVGFITVDEPGNLLLMALGLVGLGLARKFSGAR